MKLSSDEKKLLKALVKEHIKEVHESEKHLYMPPVALSIEVKYETFLRNLLKKIK